MKNYNPDKPLFSIHIPKCGGTSLVRLLQSWFGDHFYLHYYDTHQQRAPKHYPVNIPGSCIHGHFENKRGLGINAYYPAAEQFITVIRDPLDRAISNYFYTKNRIRNGKVFSPELGIKNSLQRGLDECLQNCSLFSLQFLPWRIDSFNFREVIGEHFVCIGAVERYDAYIQELAGYLAKPVPTIPVLNTSWYDEIPSEAAIDTFLTQNQLEYEIYRYVLERTGEGETLKFLNQDQAGLVKGYSAKYRAKVNRHRADIPQTRWAQVLDLRCDCRNREHFLERVVQARLGLKGQAYYLLALQNLLQHDYPAALQDIQSALGFETGNADYRQVQWVISQLLAVDRGQKPLIVFGTGSGCQQILDRFLPLQYVQYFVDNNRQKWGLQFQQRAVVDPEELMHEKPGEVYIVIASQFYDEISGQLQKMGFQAYRDFFSFADICKMN